MNHGLRIRLVAAALASAAAPELVHPGEWDLAEALTRIVMPAAPESDAAGLIMVKIIVSEEGEVTYTKALLGPDALEKPAEKAVAVGACVPRRYRKFTAFL